jgi:hypothetical protein
MAASLPEKGDRTSDLGDRGMLITFFFCQPGAGERLRKNSQES